MNDWKQPPPIEEPPGFESPQPSSLPPAVSPPPAAPGGQVPLGPGPASGGGADNRAIASMVLGIVSIVLGCIPFVGIICGTIAIVLYAKFISDFSASGERLQGKGLAIAGLVCGIIGAAIGVLYGIYWLVVGVFLGSAGLHL